MYALRDTARASALLAPSYRSVGPTGGDGSTSKSTLEESLVTGPDRIDSVMNDDGPRVTIQGNSAQATGRMFVHGTVGGSGFTHLAEYTYPLGRGPSRWQPVSSRVQYVVCHKRTA